MLAKLIGWVCSKADSQATAFLKDELAHYKETIVPTLERQLAVTQIELELAQTVNRRNIARVEAEMAISAHTQAMALGESR